MNHFYGMIDGRGCTLATRCGSRDSGLVTIAASWDGAIVVSLWVDQQGCNRFTVKQRDWKGKGINEVIAEGVIGTPVHQLARLGSQVEEAEPASVALARAALGIRRNS